MNSIFQRTIIWALITTFTALSIVGCGSQGVKEPSDSQNIELESALERAQKLITSAQLSSEPEQSALRLLAAEILLSDNEIDLAAHQVDKVFPEYLTTELFAKWSILKSSIALSEGDIELAREIVINPTIEQSLPVLATDLVTELRQLRAQFYFNEENYSASVNERILLNGLLVAQRQQILLDAGIDQVDEAQIYPVDDQQGIAEQASLRGEQQSSEQLSSGQQSSGQQSLERQTLSAEQQLLTEADNPELADPHHATHFNPLTAHIDIQIQNNESRLWHTLMEIPAQDLSELIQNHSPDAKSGISNDQLNNGKLNNSKLNNSKLNNNANNQQNPGLAHSNHYDNIKQANGWYSLALINKNNQTNIEQQLAEVNQWRMLWPNHPASIRLPADLRLLAEIAAQQPQKIAVLLPLSGKLSKLSKALRDGLMAAFYQRAQSAQQLPEIVFYDTEQENISLTYDKAVEQAAELVIGPLQKKNISELALKLELPVPILALNRIDSQIEPASGLYQFGLAVEDEINQIASQARLDGHKRALIIAPLGAWGDRNINAFAPAWQNLDGEIAYSYRYSGKGDYSSVIKEALHIGRSQVRANEIQRVVGRVGKEERRRQDIDMIFMAADLNQARQIKPTLAFYFADDIPVYTSGSIYLGSQNAKLNSDLNDIEFTSLPWFFDHESTLKQALMNSDSQQISYQKLYALGIDAFHIYPRLRQLESVNQAQFYGYTGRLKLNRQRKIVREQQWAKFIGGIAAPLNKNR